MPKFYKNPYTVNDMLGEAKKLEMKAEKMWYEEPHTRENRYRVRKNIGRILNIFDDLTSLNKPGRRGFGDCCVGHQPNIDIENYYPWNGSDGYRGTALDGIFLFILYFYLFIILFYFIFCFLFFIYFIYYFFFLFFFVFF